MDVSVRRIARGEGQVLRALRLAALSESPWAFGASLADERSRLDEDWDRRAADNARGCDAATWFAVDTATPAFVGLVTGYHPEPGRGVAQLVSMWVAPSARRCGAGGRLVVALVGWARVCGDVAVDLRVTDSNAPALRLYERLGFRPTGATEPLESDPWLTTMTMRRTL